MSPTPFITPRPDAIGPATACFAVHAACGPSVMPRVLGVFAKRGLVPLQLHGAVCPAAGGGRQQDIHIDIQIAGMEQATAARLAEDLRQMVGVIAVLISRKQYALTA